MIWSRFRAHLDVEPAAARSTVATLFSKYSSSAFLTRVLGDHGGGRIGRRAFTPGGVHSLDKVAVGGSAADVVIDVAGCGHARSDRLESPVELGAINVVAGYGHAGPGIGWVPVEEDAMSPPAGPDPEEHHADNPEKKDNQNQDRQA